MIWWYASVGETSAEGRDVDTKELAGAEWGCESEEHNFALPDLPRGGCGPGREIFRFAATDAG